MSTGKIQDQANTQVIDMNKLEAKTRDFAVLGIPRPFHLPNSMQFEHSEIIPTKTSLESFLRSDEQLAQEPLVIGKAVESKKLLEAAKEIVNLIHKDYKGNDRPRRKPPINNHVPKH
ncbi:hypothetical protein CCACVL1_29171 [Corchorus capsularis]|uniref:Uncharacterized protein n=1 Tax=Corchorus capsularis TaxID=210143 RepID=A0A1R3G3E5_COCAP|nr:hypothetical protein CCACVL1_29171 [Corchorus capsularis]